jgi:hypothetical protein
MSGKREEELSQSEFGNVNGSLFLNGSMRSGTNHHTP